MSLTRRMPSVTGSTGIAFWLLVSCTRDSGKNEVDMTETKTKEVRWGKEKKGGPSTNAMQYYNTRVGETVTWVRSGPAALYENIVSL
ncbi:hypothetical protein C8R44DRAFT_771661 [Mycena epipterygia]|nr:hypothetical protein C8R44DRAFT_771661 [Mycena epipterygia]